MLSWWCSFRWRCFYCCGELSTIAHWPSSIKARTYWYTYIFGLPNQTGKIRAVLIIQKLNIFWKPSLGDHIKNRRLFLLWFNRPDKLTSHKKISKNNKITSKLELVKYQRQLIQAYLEIILWINFKCISNFNK